MATREDQLQAQLDQLRRQLADRDSQESNLLSFLGGLALGTLLGGALALILAPQSGEETRGQLRDTSIQLKERASGVAGGLPGQAQDALGQVRERAQSLGERAQDQVQHIAIKAPSADEAKGRAQQAASTAAGRAADTAREASAMGEDRTQDARDATASRAQTPPPADIDERRGSIGGTGSEVKAAAADKSSAAREAAEQQAGDLKESAGLGKSAAQSPTERGQGSRPARPH
ncbi:MAG TPA: YtxH domain-containing protein [Thermomicrobiales bacterium]|nr:YtxH domain-containing protein [Thermomicrobiales bacterium]